MTSASGAGRLLYVSIQNVPNKACGGGRGLCTLAWSRKQVVEIRFATAGCGSWYGRTAPLLIADDADHLAIVSRPPVAGAAERATVLFAGHVDDPDAFSTMEVLSLLNTSGWH